MLSGSWLLVEPLPPASHDHVDDSAWLTSYLQWAGVTEKEAVFSKRQQSLVLVPAHGGCRVTTDRALQHGHATDRQRLVLRSVVNDRRRTNVAVYTGKHTHTHGWKHTMSSTSWLTFVAHLSLQYLECQGRHQVFKAGCRLTAATALSVPLPSFTHPKKLRFARISWVVLLEARRKFEPLDLPRPASCGMLNPVYTIKQTSSKCIQNTRAWRVLLLLDVCLTFVSCLLRVGYASRMLDVCSTFAWCLLNRVNGVL